jgi:hypothetical protein
MTSRSHQTATSIYIINIYSIGFCCSERLTRGPTRLQRLWTLSIYIERERAQVYCSERLTSRTHPTAACMNIINIYSTGLLFRDADIEDPPNYSDYQHYQSERFRTIKASSHQWCGTDNRTDRLASGIHGPNHRLLHRATWARSRERKK